MGAGLALGLCVMRANTLLAECREGLKDTLQWRRAPKPEPQAPVPAAEITPALPPPEEKKKPPEKSALMRDFERTAEKIAGADRDERIRYLASLRRQFPEDFTDALKFQPNDGVLRRPVKGLKRLRVRQGASYADTRGMTS
jgi:hypothetical protein